MALGILKELHTNWGIAPGEEMVMVKALAGAWEVGEDAGLGALAKAVERELAVTQVHVVAVTARPWPTAPAHRDISRAGTSAHA